MCCLLLVAARTAGPNAALLLPYENSLSDRHFPYEGGFERELHAVHRYQNARAGLVKNARDPKEDFMEETDEQRAVDRTAHLSKQKAAEDA